MDRTLLFAFVVSAAGVTAQKTKSLSVMSLRVAVCAVKAAFCAFIAAKRRALTGEADGLGAVFAQEGLSVGNVARFCWPLSLRVDFPVAVRRQPRDAFKDAGEVRLLREAGLKGDFNNRQA
jgi:hypothetical protein